MISLAARAMLSVCYVTVPTREIAIRLSRKLVSSKAAACVNIIPQITSVYEWEGKVEEAAEQLLMIKTQTATVPRVVAVVEEEGFAECPEVIATAITGGRQPYLDWVVDQTSER